MRVPELKAFTRDRGLRNYYRMRTAELVALLQNNPPPAPQMSTWEPIDDRLIVRGLERGHMHPPPTSQLGLYFHILHVKSSQKKHVNR